MRLSCFLAFLLLWAVDAFRAGAAVPDSLLTERTVRSIYVNNPDSALRLLDEAEKAEQLAAYAEKTFADIAAMDIPEEEKIRLYCGSGQDSLETAPAGSSHGQLSDLVNAVNVAALELGEGTRVQISAEQLLAWDPDVIVTLGEAKAGMSGSAAAMAILENPDYAALKAVRNGAVYGVPNAPFSWVDRPPASNRLVGVRWLSGLLYPQYLTFDVDEEVREFFSLFYHVDLTDEQLQALYGERAGGDGS